MKLCAILLAGTIFAFASISPMQSAFAAGTSCRYPYGMLCDRLSRVLSRIGLKRVRGIPRHARQGACRRDQQRGLRRRCGLKQDLLRPACGSPLGPSTSFRS